MNREKLKPKSPTEFQNLNKDSESILSVIAMYLGATGVTGVMAYRTACSRRLARRRGF